MNQVTLRQRATTPRICLTLVALICCTAAAAAPNLVPISPPTLVPVGLTALAGAATGIPGFGCGTTFGGAGFLKAGAIPQAQPIDYTQTLSGCGMTGSQQQFAGLGPAALVADAAYAINPGPNFESFSGTVHATASYGVLGASAQTDFGCPPSGCISGLSGFEDVSFGFATFTDQLTWQPGQTLLGFCPFVTCTPPTGTDSGYLNLSFTVAGSASGPLFSQTSGSGLGAIEIGEGFLSGNTGETEVGQCFDFLVTSGVVTCPFNLGFTYNVPFDLTVGFAALADAGIYGTNVSTFADFLSTVTLSGIQVFDNQGLQWGGWTASSASGTQYGENGVVGGNGGGGGAAPEPATLALLGIGLAGLAVSRRRKLT